MGVFYFSVRRAVLLRPVVSRPRSATPAAEPITPAVRREKGVSPRGKSAGIRSAKASEVEERFILIHFLRRMNGEVLGIFL